MIWHMVINNDKCCDNCKFNNECNLRSEDNDGSECDNYEGVDDNK